MSREYSVIAIEQTSPTTMVFTLRSIDPDYLLAYQPGQYATLSFMLHGRPTPARCFSISSSPTEQDILQFGMRVKGAYTTTAAKHIKVGDKVSVAGPYGRFIFNRERDKTAIFLAGGIGITPFMSMIRYATRLQLENNILLVYSVQNQHDIPFKDELLYIQNINAHFRVVFVVSDGDLSEMAGTSVMSGRMTPELLNSALGGVYDNMSFFVCGPPMFMKTMLTSLRIHAVPEGRILTEAFSQAAQKHSAWISWPSHMYALTALGLLVGTGATLAHDITAVKQPKLATTGTTYAGNQTTSSSSRGSQIDGQLTDLNGGTGTDGTVTDGTTADGGTNSGTTTTGGTTTKTGGGTITTGGSTGTGGGTGTTGSGGSGSTGGTTTTPTAPTLNFSSNTTTINTGGNATLSWSVTAGTAPVTCTASNGWTGTKGATGTLSVSPTATTTYTLACKNSVNTATKSVTINVTAAPIAPTLNFSASSTTITAGGSTTLSWSVPSGTTPITCTASGGWSGGQPTSGSLSVSPTATTTYTLTCANSVSSVPKSVTINVNAAPVAPTVNFSASSTTITAGGSTTLSWSTSGTSPISCTGSGWSPSGPSGSATVSPGSTTTFTITCSNSAGSQSKQVTVTVNPVSSGS